MAAALTVGLPLSPSEVPDLALQPLQSTISAIDARLLGPSPSALILTSVPLRVFDDRPLEVELAAVERSLGDRAASSVAACISENYLLFVEIQGMAHAVPITARNNGGCCIARALIDPATWSDAYVVTVVSLTLAGRPLPSQHLPKSLPVGYNHDPAPAGAVHAAAKAGKAQLLQVALGAGGSTEETDEVREHLIWGSGVRYPAP